MTDISAAFKLVISFIHAPAQKLFENGDDGFVPIGLKQTVVGFDYSMRIECVQPDYRFSVLLSDGQAHFIALSAVGDTATGIPAFLNADSTFCLFSAS